jgi:DNA primase
MGYATTGNALLRHLQHDGFSEQELQAAGVIGVTEEEGRPYDFFRDRVLFPIRDPQGRTIAFGGRSLDDGSQPKYLNSRDTMLFHKHETLFAFDLARKPAIQEHQVVIVEGYMDAATAHQHGYRNVVATLGTAVSDRHLRRLRQIDDIVLALDADAAGQAATWRALQVAEQSLRVGLSPVVGPTRRKLGLVPDRSAHLRVLALPGAKDPDELIRSDPHVWPTLVQGAMSVIDFVLQRLEARHDLSTAQGKAAAANEFADVLAGIASPIEQDHYTNEVATRLKVDPGAVRRLLHARHGRATAQRVSPPTPAPPRPSVVRGDVDDDYLLALLMRLRESRDAPPIEGPLEFVLAETRLVYEALDGELPPGLEPYADRARRHLPDVARMSTPHLMRDLEETRLRIKKRLLERQIKEISSLGEDVEVRKLMHQLVALAQDIGAIDQQLPPERERAGSR